MTATLSLPLTCTAVAADLVAYLDGELTACKSTGSHAHESHAHESHAHESHAHESHAHEIQAHLDGCEACRREAAALRRSWATLSVSAEPIPAPKLRGRDFAAAVLAKAQLAQLTDFDSSLDSVALLSDSSGQLPALKYVPAPKLAAQLPTAPVAQSTPAQSTPAQPTPAQPTPAQPTPAQPTPAQPTPAVPVWRLRAVLAAAAVLGFVALPIAHFGSGLLKATRTQPNGVSNRAQTNSTGTSENNINETGVSETGVASTAPDANPTGSPSNLATARPLNLPKTQDVVPPQLRDLDTLREKFATGSREQFFTHELRGPDPLLDVLARDDKMSENKMMLKVMDLGGMVVMEGKNNIESEVQEN